MSRQYGATLARFGKWIVTEQGILFERSRFGETDYFINARYITDLNIIRNALTHLGDGGWLGELEYYQFNTAWFFNLSLLDQYTLHSADQTSLAQTLLYMHHSMKRKLSITF